MSVGRSTVVVVPLLFLMLVLNQAQQPRIGVVPPWGSRPWVFDPAEQHKIRAHGRRERTLASLVVETTNFTDMTNYCGASKQLRMIGRFTPITPTLVEWAVFDDEHTWARPWTFAMNLTKDDTQQVRVSRRQLGTK